jgi:hypothetical protein
MVQQDRKWLTNIVNPHPLAPSPASGGRGKASLPREPWYRRNGKKPKPVGALE